MMFRSSLILFLLSGCGSQVQTTSITLPLWISQNLPVSF